MDPAPYDGTTDNGPPFPPSLLFAQYIQNWVTLLAHLTTLSTMGVLLLATEMGWSFVRINKLSFNLRLLFGAYAFFAALGIPYQLYRILLWTDPAKATPLNNYGNRYSFESLYWLSLSEFVYYGSIPAVVLLLTLERSLTLKFPLSWLTRKFPLISIFAFFCIVIFNTAGHLVELPLDYTLATICQSASCTTSRYRLYFQIDSKIVLCCADVIVSILFLFLLRETGAAKKLNNRVILLTLLIEFLLGVVPTFVFVVLNKVLNTLIGGVPNGGEKGELMVAFCALDGAALGLLYWLLLYRRTSNAVVNGTANHQQPKPHPPIETRMDQQQITRMHSSRLEPTQHANLPCVSD